MKGEPTPLQSAMLEQRRKLMEAAIHGAALDWPRVGPFLLAGRPVVWPALAPLTRDEVRFVKEAIVREVRDGVPPEPVVEAACLAPGSDT